VYRYKKIENLSDPQIKSLVLQYSKKCEKSCILDSNVKGESNHNLVDGGYDYLAGLGAVEFLQADVACFESLDGFEKNHQSEWKFLSLSYDLKNEVEALESINPDLILFPNLSIFIPEIIVSINGDVIRIGVHNSVEMDIDNWIQNHTISSELVNVATPLKEIKAHTPKERYIKQFNRLLDHIQFGDIYEINYCQTFSSSNVEEGPQQLFERLNAIGKAPFSALYIWNGLAVISASPERYLAKRGSTLFSQPIKGTVKRGATKKEDEELSETLYQNEKERSENVMIVDLVRNDLSKVAQMNSVKVDELFGIYSFEQVFQMISTVSCKVKEGISFVDILKATYPMGSMTGAPKVRAMQLIEMFEDTKRGIYSGAVGYISPEGDFDLNVVIRSLMYNGTNKALSFSVGSAITINANAEDEYNECLLKASGILKALGLHGVD
jgi:para-aminobenzoate synthetase component 1